MRNLRYLLFLVYLYSGISYATELTTPLLDYTLERWDSSNGLPQNSINGLVQTGDGYLWLAT